MEIEKYQVSQNRISGDCSYLNYWRVYIDRAFPKTCETPSCGLLMDMERYLISCTDRVVPPRDELIDSLMGYCSSQARKVEGFPEFEELANELKSSLSSISINAFKPMNPAGVMMAMAMFSAGDLAAFLKAILDFFRVLAEVLEMLRRLESRSMYSEWALEKPLKLEGIVEFRMWKCAPLQKHLYMDSQNMLTAVTMDYDKALKIPQNRQIVAVTTELCGTSFLLSEQPVVVDLNTGTISSQGYIYCNKMGASSVHITSFYSVLKNPAEATVNAIVIHPFYIPPPVDPKFHVTSIIGVQAKYYSLL